jgi:hypothetical protein
MTRWAWRKQASQLDVSAFSDLACAGKEPELNVGAHRKLIAIWRFAELPCVLAILFLCARPRSLVWSASESSSEPSR